MSEHYDAALIEELKSIMEEDFPVLIETFIQDSEERVVNLSAAVDGSVAEDIRTIAHSFKGSSSNIGATGLVSLCQMMETMGRENDLEKASQQFEAIKIEYELLRSELQALL